MGLLRALFGNNKVKKPKKYEVRYDSVTSYKQADFEKFMDFYSLRPVYEDYMDRSFDMPHFSDEFKTDEGYKLRELLLLIWWGKLKKGRLADAEPPRYFFYDYNLDSAKTTRKLLRDNLLIVENEKMVVTELGKELSTKYGTLWDIHSFKHFPTNLDLDFPNWDLDQYLLMYYKVQVSYLTDFIDYRNKKIDFLKTSTYPEKKSERNEDIKILSLDNDRDEKTIADYLQKISVLEDK